MEHDLDDGSSRAPVSGIVDQVRNGARDPSGSAQNRGGRALDPERDRRIVAPHAVDSAAREIDDVDQRERLFLAVAARQLDEVTDRPRKLLDLLHGVADERPPLNERQPIDSREHFHDRAHRR
jgi:hypothetical protein